MKYTYTKNKKRIITFKNLIVKYHLHLAHGGMRFALENPSQIRVIGLAFHSNIPIASCLITNDNIMYYCNVGVFVHRKYRKMGIGRKLLEYVASSGDYKFNCYTGTTASRRLYKGFT